jgi:hypothetical protein
MNDRTPLVCAGSRLPTVQNWSEHTSKALAYRLVELARLRPLLYKLFKQTEQNLNIHDAYHTTTKDI